MPEPRFFVFQFHVNPTLLGALSTSEKRKRAISLEPTCAIGLPSCLISCSTPNSFDAKHIELAFDVAEGGPGHLSSRNPLTERGPKAIARRLAGRRAI
jgi:hypothetical protein